MLNSKNSRHRGGARFAFSQTAQALINNDVALTFRWLLLLASFAMAVPVSAKTENPAVTALTNTAASHLATGALEQAANALERALRIEPQNPRLWHFLAQIHHQRGDYEQARDMAERSSGLAGDDAGLKAQNTWLTALTDQASQRRGAPSNEAVKIEELLNEKRQTNHLSKQEITTVKRVLDTERAQGKEFLETVPKQAPRTESSESKWLSSALEQESAECRETEAALAAAEKKSHRVSQQLNAARVDLKVADRQLAVAQQQYRQAETMLRKTLARNSRLEKQFSQAVAKTPSMDKQAKTVAALLKELAAEHEYSLELEEKNGVYREWLERQERELRGLRHTLVSVERRLDREIYREDRSLLGARGDYGSWRKKRRIHHGWGDDDDD